MGKEKFAQIIAIVEQVVFTASKLLVFVGFIIFKVMWKVVGHMLNLTDEMASFFAFGDRRSKRKDSWW